MVARVKELEKLLIFHKQQYYRGDAKISDEEYDKLEDELKQLAPDSKVLAVVGYEVTTNKVAHTRPMLSLDKRRDPADVSSWMENEQCVVTDKMDGSSCSLVYKDGVFVVGKTRGDGSVGENLTAHLKYVSMPKILFNENWQNGEVEIRGELCISKSNFERLAVEMENRKLETPKSIRNIVAGLLHKKSDLNLCNYLTFFAYEILGDEIALSSEIQKFDLLKEEGFIAPHMDVCTTPDSFVESVNSYEARLEGAEFLTDGLVIAVDNIEAQIGRGFTAHHPKGKIAFKFKSDLATTTVEDIVVDVGRTGRITFVGVVTPVMLSGAKVSRVTLNNAKYIRENNINIGCKIEITRSGEVIPKHERTLQQNGEYTFLTACPFCDEPLGTSESGVDLVCTNDNCRSKKQGRISNWISVLNIENIGDRTLDMLFEQDIVLDIPGLYNLEFEQVRNLERLGDKSANNILKNINNSKTQPFDKFLTALGIDGLGPSISKLIVKEFGTPELLKVVTVEQLEQIDGIGPILARNIVAGMDSFGWNILNQLEILDFKILEPKKLEDDSLTDKSFVITGKLSKPRAELKSFIEGKGGKVIGSVSKNTSYLVCNEASSSSKYKKATSLEIPIITEDELLDL